MKWTTLRRTGVILSVIGTLFFFSVGVKNLFTLSTETLLQDAQNAILYLLGGFAFLLIFVFSIPSKDHKTYKEAEP